MEHPAGIAQLVEHDLAKVGVEGPSPFSRSKRKRTTLKWFFFFYVLVWVGYSTPWGRGCGIIWLMHEVRRDELCA